MGSETENPQSIESENTFRVLSNERLEVLRSLYKRFSDDQSYKKEIENLIKDLESFKAARYTADSMPEEAAGLLGELRSDLERIKATGRGKQMLELDRLNQELKQVRRQEVLKGSDTPSKTPQEDEFSADQQHREAA